MQMTVFYGDIFGSPRHSHYAVSAVLTFWSRNTIQYCTYSNNLIMYVLYTVYMQCSLEAHKMFLNFKKISKLVFENLLIIYLFKNSKIKM